MLYGKRNLEKLQYILVCNCKGLRSPPTLGKSCQCFHRIKITHGYYHFKVSLLPVILAYTHTLQQNPVLSFFISTAHIFSASALTSPFPVRHHNIQPNRTSFNAKLFHKLKHDSLSVGVLVLMLISVSKFRVCLGFVVCQCLCVHHVCQCGSPRTCESYWGLRVVSKSWRKMLRYMQYY